MEDGQLNNYVGAIVQARMKSSRLPGKILFRLPFSADGKPLLGWVVDSLKKSKQIKKIVLATSQEPEDDVLIDYAKDNDLTLYRGSEENVLKRFADVVEAYQFDTVVRLTADNPIIAVPEMDDLIIRHLQKDNDYTCSENMPLGMNIEIVKGKILAGITNRNDLTAHDKEHVTSYIRRVSMFNKEFFPLIPPNLTEKIRLTIDYPIDYAVLNIVAQYSIQTGLAGLELVNYITEKAIWVWDINISSYQIKHYADQREELSLAIKKLKELGLFRAAAVIENAI